MKSVINYSPKEKAQELVQKYYNRFEHTISDEYAEVEFEVCKECALIAIDEILKLDNEITYLNKQKKGYTIYTHISFWKEVKQEIGKL